MGRGWRQGIGWRATRPGGGGESEGAVNGAVSTLGRVELSGLHHESSGYPDHLGNAAGVLTRTTVVVFFCLYSEILMMSRPVRSLFVFPTTGVKICRVYLSYSLSTPPCPLSQLRAR